MKSTIFNVDQMDTLLQVDIADTQFAQDFAEKLPQTQPMMEEQSPKLHQTSAEQQDLKSWEGTAAEVEESPIDPPAPFNMNPLLEEVAAEAPLDVEIPAAQAEPDLQELPDGTEEDVETAEKEEVVPPISPVKDWGY